MKPATPKKSEGTKNDIAVRILKIGYCPSLSGKSTLTYHVGCSGSEIVVRIFANSSSGYFNKEWVPMTAIMEIFAKHPADKTLTSFALSSIYQGKSTNSSGFLLAALVQEGFVRHLVEKDRGYERLEPTNFMAEVASLMASDVSLDPEKKANDKQKKARQKAVPVSLS